MTTPRGAEPVPLTCVSLTRADFEVVLAALEPDAEDSARDEAQDVLQSHAPRRWLQELEDAENVRRDQLEGAENTVWREVGQWRSCW